MYTVKFSRTGTLQEILVQMNEAIVLEFHREEIN
jgi:hypothetical protein